jgi:tetratricopeptide (TPR) repeat protein
MFALARERGQVKELEPVLQLFMRERGASSSWRTGLALIYAELGRTDEARSEFDHLARNNFVDLAQDTLWMGSMAFLTDVCLCVGDKVRATRLYQMLLPYDGTNLVVGHGVVCYGALSRYLGVLASLLENWNEAERHFNDALAMNTRMETPVWVAHTQYHYANMLLGRGRGADRNQGLAILNSAVVTARQLGMRSLEKRAAAAMAVRLPSRNSAKPG